ncbi:hypothetical protein [Curtobacterium sp. MCBD17_040]|uniref:hypothetical protein n=1 Tax=Curtobacterium sp. MCBD17_040 TaxID=2175674 RepID=UPI000DA9F6E2|nr:hypothetical protein [Curtobacterium sp. MCBD17_040]WIB65293.1 hypothetical protein DEI94_17970 [Curtobacterium sp. MCBD17_040]
MTISKQAEAAREAARADSGKFGEQQHDQAPASVALEDFKAKAANTTLASIGDLRDDIDKAEFVAAVEAITATVKQEFPTAAVLELQDDAEYEPGSEFWMPKQILDADGVVLWDAPTREPYYDDLSETLADDTPTLDRLGRDPVDLTPELGRNDPNKRYGLRL